MKSFRCLLPVLVLLSGFALGVHAQWRTQEIMLNPGWNAVFLEVDPEPRNSSIVLSGLPVESVWLYIRRSAAPQFISDPRQLTPESPDWLVWVGDTATGPALNTLYAMPGGRPYLIKISGNQPVVWSVRGRPAIRPQKYEGRAFNFVGFHLDPAVPVTFQSFFAPSTALNNQTYYDLDASGEWKAVTNPTTTMLCPGRAYWVFANAPTECSGPSAITVDQQSSIAFGPIGRSASLRLRLGTGLWILPAQEILKCRLPDPGPTRISLPVNRGVEQPGSSSGS